MCLIIDANVISEFTSNPPSPAACEIIRWLDGAGRIVYSADLRQELFRNERFRRLLLIWSQAGKAKLIPEQGIKNELNAIASSGHCRSNDGHVIAVARASGARTLFSHDKLLHNDFKNSSLIKRPKGKIFQSPAHKRNLIHTGSCIRFQK